MTYYAALISVVQSLEMIINRDKYPKFFLDKQHLASIYEKLSHLKEILVDYSPKDEEGVDCLERRIRDAAYQVHDILEDQDIIEYKISDLIPTKGKTDRVKTLRSRLLISKLKRAMPKQLQEIEKAKEEIDSIVEEVMRMKIKKSHTTQDLKLINYSSTSEQEPMSTSCGDTVVGFEERLTTIKDQLCGASSKLEVVPLVGMGGIGKTTLAKSIFVDRLIVHHFDCRAWVTVSQDYNLKKILLDILDSMEVDTKKLSGVEEEELVVRIYQYMKERRYLIIMDDMWDTKVWDAVRRIFPDDNNGSRIIITTRLLDVAVYANRCASVHQMQFLNEDQSWDLLREKVLAQENCPRELEDIGRLIAKNCGGLPLAIVVVAGFLSKVNKAPHDWEEIARNVNSTSIENDEHLSKIFSLSYNQLPHHLKPCFLYIGGFPEDYEIIVSRLIKLWGAEGFLKSSDESKSLEEMGEKYLKDLVERNLILITKKKTNGKFKCCSIHDILRDLCMKRACYESFLHIHTKETKNIIRRLCIHPTRSKLKAEEFGPHVGSILCFHDNSKLLSFATCFKRLRVLDALEVGFCSFPPVEVLELCYLRYLTLGHGNTSEFNLISQIARLENLQTLIVGLLGQAKVSSPFPIWKMPNLRHVNVPMLHLSSPTPSDCILENLRTLSTVENFKFTNRSIQMIPNLKKLKVLYTNDESNETWEKFCLYNLVQLLQLETLDICFVKERPMLRSFLGREENDLQSHDNLLLFPHKLKKLSLEGCKISWKDMTAVGSLPNLEVLKLRKNAFVGDEWETIEGEFPRLKFLLMERLELKYWRAEDAHFPRLKHLKIAYCRKLEEIPLGIGDIPTLELIEVQDSDFAANSAVQIQNEQQDMGNDDLQVHVYGFDWNTREKLKYPMDEMLWLREKPEYSLDEKLWLRYMGFSKAIKAGHFVIYKCGKHGQESELQKNLECCLKCYIHL